MASVIVTDEIITTKQVLNKWRKPVSSDVMTIEQLIKLRVELEVEEQGSKNNDSSFLVKDLTKSLDELTKEAIKAFKEGKFFISVGGYEAKSLTDRVFLYRKTAVKFYQISLYQ